MANSDQLSKNRANTVINKTSKKEDKLIQKVTREVIDAIESEYSGIKVSWDNTLYLKDILSQLEAKYKSPGFQFAKTNNARSNMRPDGGIVSIVDKDGNKYPILIGEVKNQGTNNKRRAAGLPNQSLGNAVERLGKNVIGMKTFMMEEEIFPFVCFGDGCDFAKGSSILDRVVTIAMFGELNKIHVKDEGPFKRGSFFFREKAWTDKEMRKILLEVAETSIQYYIGKYKKERFM